MKDEKDVVKDNEEVVQENASTKKSRKTKKTDKKNVVKDNEEVVQENASTKKSRKTKKTDKKNVAEVKHHTKVFVRFGKYSSGGSRTVCINYALAKKLEKSGACKIVKGE